MQQPLTTLLCLALAAAAAPQQATQPATGPATQPSTQQAGGGEERRAMEDAGRFVMEYHRAPQPQRVPGIVATMSRAGFLSARGGEVGPAAGFLRTVFAQQDAETLKQWAAGFAQLPSEDQATLATMLWAADTNAAREAMASLSAQGHASVANRVAELSQRRPLPLVEVDLDSPDVLDALWGGWFASGDGRYVRRITEAMPLLDTMDPSDRARRPTEEEMARYVVGGAARWSLTSNAIQDERVLEVLEAAQGDASPAVARHLREVIETARLERRVRGG